MVQRTRRHGQTAEHQALCVMESIRALARAGHVVACTIHQPRQAIVAAWMAGAAGNHGEIIGKSWHFAI